MKNRQPVVLIRIALSIGLVVVLLSLSWVLLPNDYAALANLPRPASTATPGPLPDKFLFAIGSRTPIRQFGNLESVAVAPDGMLYVALGDGGL